MYPEHIFPKNKWVLGALTALILFILLFRLDALPLKYEEPRRALIATEMMLSENYLVPTTNGYFYYNKPPLFNWILVLFFKLFGNHEFSERLPTLLSAIFIAITMWAFFRKRLDTEAGLLGGFSFLLSGHMLLYFSFQGEIDMTFSCITFLQLLSIIYFFDRKNYWSLFLLSYLLMVVGFFLKGLPAVAFQGLSLMGIFFTHKAFKPFFHLAHFLAGFAAIGLIGLYFMLYSNYHDAEIYLANILFESTRRTTEAANAAGLILQLFRFPLFLGMLLLPFSLLLVFTKKHTLSRLLQNKWTQYICILLVVNLPIYWISSGTKDRYLYMFLPFLYLLLYELILPLNQKQQKQLSISCLILSSLMIMGCIASLFLIDGTTPESVMVPVLFLSVIAYLTIKKNIHAFMSLLLVMIGLRVAYNQIIFPQRMQSQDNLEAKLFASEIDDIVAGKSLSFLSKDREVIVGIPLRKEKKLHDLNRLPHQFSYYYSTKTNQVIPLTLDEPTTDFYLLETSTFDRESLYDFTMQGRNFQLFSSR